MQRTSHKPNEINASSMADIAFLLLIFFLVTTTMDMDKGLLTLLPPYEAEETPTDPINERNILEILVNSSDDLLVEGKSTNIQELKDISKQHVTNEGRNPNFSDSPLKAVISLKNDRGTSYERYVEVHNEIRAAYNEIRNEYSQQKYGLKFKDLSNELQLEVRETYPIFLSEAEPEELGVLW